jgi:signal-transduction protein with cAMP-binding, CBS, and nucleotidyltransferase domain
MIDTKPDTAYGPFGSTSRTDGPKPRDEGAGDARESPRERGRGVGLPRASATQHELTRIELLAGLPGEILGRLAKRMEREEVAPGTVLMREGEPGDRFYVLLSGVLSVSQRDLGALSLLRPGDYFGEVATAMGVPRTATVAAMTPAVVASCDQETFDELVRPLFADDD